MRTALPLILSIGLATAGCARLASSNLNPFNWFGASTSVASVSPGARIRPLVGPGELTQIVETRPLVATVTALRVDRTPGGAIVVANGDVPTEGYFNAELVAAGVQNGVMTFAFRAEAPPGFEATGTPATRQITVATQLDNADLAGVRTIRVEGQTNAQTASR